MTSQLLKMEHMREAPIGRPEIWDIHPTIQAIKHGQWPTTHQFSSRWRCRRPEDRAYQPIVPCGWDKGGGATREREREFA